MIIRDIVEQYLTKNDLNDYDGLFSESGECGCRIGDLMPCGEAFPDCQAGFSGPDLNGDCDFWIYPSREARAKAIKKIEEPR